MRLPLIGTLAYLCLRGSGLIATVLDDERGLSIIVSMAEGFAD